MSNGNNHVFEVKHYMVIWRQAEQREFSGKQVTMRGMVRCTGEGDEKHTMDVIFYAPGSEVPEPMFDKEKKKGYMFLPISEIAAFVDVLRNERPIFAHLRGDRPEWTSITTTQEPVGEGEIE